MKESLRIRLDLPYSRETAAAISSELTTLLGCLGNISSPTRMFLEDLSKVMNPKRDGMHPNAKWVTEQQEAT